MSIGFLLCHWGMRVASSERIKQLTWKGKELVERQSRLVTQAWVTFCGCYNIKIDWFGLQVLSLVSVILDYEPRLTMFFLCWQNWAHLPVFMSLSVLIQPIDSNQNNLNLKEPACEFHTPIIFFFHLSSLPTSSLLLLISHSQWKWWNKSCPQHNSFMQEFTQQQRQAAHTQVSSQQGSCELINTASKVTCSFTT